MKSFVRRYDEEGAALVGKLPASLRPISLWIGRFTSPLMWIVILVSITVLWFSPGSLPITVLVAVLFIPLATFMKFFFRRNRPPTIYADSMKIKSYSFPSSHAYSSALAGGLIAYLTALEGLWYVSVLISLVPLFVGVSRIHIGAHYPSDVTAGWLFGIFALTITITIS